MLARIDAACSDPVPHESITCLRRGIMLAWVSTLQFCSVFSASLKVISDCEEFLHCVSKLVVTYQALKKVQGIDKL